MSDHNEQSGLGKMWGRLNNIYNDGQMDTQTFDIIDATILLIEGIQEVYKQEGINLDHDPDMKHRIKLATDAINTVLGL